MCPVLSLVVQRVGKARAPMTNASAGRAMSSKRSLTTVRYAAALVVLGVGLLGYILARVRLPILR
jgi:hypothetical protein